MSQDFITPPPQRGTVDEGERVSRPWAVWFQQVFAIAFAVAQSGTTTQRPTEGLFTGRPYFDTDLGHIIHYDGSGWVDATGASV